jgi:hydrogenase nickel incorporation protein HypB
MCATCGCSDGGAIVLFPRAHAHAHEHDHAHGEELVLGLGLRHDQAIRLRSHDGDRRLIQLEHDLLAKNDALAADNRFQLAERGIVALNLLGSPGAGKTTLLERTVRALAPLPVSVLEGDQDTSHDAERVRAAGARALQINTGSGCHLDAAMVSVGLEALEPQPGSLLFIENVGNLVCPSLFALGEQAKVVLLSVTEGEDKPLKYPHAFRSASVLVITKIDLLPHLRFDLDRCLDHARRVNPWLRVFCLSAERGEGLGAWCDWLRSEVGAVSSRDISPLP